VESGGRGGQEKQIDVGRKMAGVAFCLSPVRDAFAQSQFSSAAAEIAEFARPQSGIVSVGKPEIGWERPMTCARNTADTLGSERCKSHHRIPNGHGVMVAPPELAMSDVEVTTIVATFSCLPQAKSCSCASYQAVDAGTPRRRRG
jgi:hypothetical protein